MISIFHFRKIINRNGYRYSQIEWMLLLVIQLLLTICCASIETETFGFWWNPITMNVLLSYLVFGVVIMLSNGLAFICHLCTFKLNGWMKNEHQKSDYITCEWHVMGDMSNEFSFNNIKQCSEMVELWIRKKPQS